MPEIPPNERHPPLAVCDPVNAIEYAKEAEFAAARFSYLIEKRDQLQDRLRFGVLALNGASLVALLGFLNGQDKAATWLGFSAENAKYSAAFFGFGVVLAAFSAIPQSNLFTNEAADANTRRLQASWLASFHAAEASPENWDKLKKLAEEFGNLPLVDFQYSPAAIWLQNFAGGAWLAGVLLPLGNVIF